MSTIRATHILVPAKEATLLGVIFAFPSKGLNQIHYSSDPYD